MQLFITILHVMLSLALILIILLQPGKEGAAVFGGGGGNQAYGPRGQANFLGRATTLVAAMFMVTSITLAYRSSTRTQAGTGNLEEVMQEGLELDEVPMLTTPGDAAVEPAPAPAADGSPEVPAAPADGGVAPAAPAGSVEPGGATGPETDAAAPEGTASPEGAEGTPMPDATPSGAPEAAATPADGANP